MTFLKKTTFLLFFYSFFFSLSLSSNEDTESDTEDDYILRTKPWKKEVDRAENIPPTYSRKRIAETPLNTKAKNRKLAKETEDYSRDILKETSDKIQELSAIFSKASPTEISYKLYALLALSPQDSLEEIQCILEKCQKKDKKAFKTFAKLISQYRVKKELLLTTKEKALTEKTVFFIDFLLTKYFNPRKINFDLGHSLDNINKEKLPRPFRELKEWLKRIGLNSSENNNLLIKEEENSEYRWELESFGYRYDQWLNDTRSLPPLQQLEVLEEKALKNIPY